MHRLAFDAGADGLAFGHHLPAGAQRGDAHRLARGEELPGLQVGLAQGRAGRQAAAERAADRRRRVGQGDARRRGDVHLGLGELAGVEHGAGGQRGLDDRGLRVDADLDRDRHVPQLGTLRAAQADAGRAPDGQAGRQVGVDVLAGGELQARVELADLHVHADALRLLGGGRRRAVAGHVLHLLQQRAVGGVAGLVLGERRRREHGQRHAGEAMGDGLGSKGRCGVQGDWA